MLVTSVTGIFSIKKSVAGPIPITQTLIFGCAGDADKLDPADVTDGESTARTDSIFEGLVEYKEGSAEIQPCLATSWVISPDGKNITFYLRQGVKFQDGTDFNANAVVFSFERQYNTSHPYYQYGEWAYWGYMFSDIQRVEKINDYTVKISLRRPNAAILTSLAMFTVVIVSPTNAAQYGADAFKHPCGTGPFKFVEWVKDDHITLIANEEYWRGAPKIDSLIFKVITDPSERLLALQTNAIQGMEYPDPASFDTIKADHNLTLLAGSGMNIGYLAINNGYGYYDTNQNGVHDSDEPWVQTPGYFEPFTNRLVRQAINYAINKIAIVEDLYKGTAIVAKNGMPPFMLGYNDAVLDYPYDPAMAIELLAEAGYPNGFNTTLWVMPVSRPYMFDPSKIGEAIQSYLEDVNIHVQIYQIDWSTYLAKTQAGEHPMCLLGWTGDNGDPDNFMNVLYGANQCSLGTAGNVAFYNNSEVQDLFSAALQTYDTNVRAQLYKEAQAIIHEDAPFVYLAHANQHLVFRSNVEGYIMNPTGRMFFYPVEIIVIPDSEKPSKVTGLSVTDAKNGKLNLVWNAATDNVAVDHYKIYRDNVFLLNRTSTSYQDTGLTNGQSYSYKVSAVDTSGNEGNQSDSASGTPTASSGGGGSSGGSENEKPMADASAGEPYQGFVNSEIIFDGSKSNDPDGNITKWFWVFGDDTNGTGKTISHIYTKAGMYTVTLIVTDNEGATKTDTTTCVIKQPNRPPTIPTIEGPTNGTKNTMYTFTALSTDADNDTIQYTFDWGEPISVSSGFLPSGTIYTVNHSWATPGIYSITVTVSDNLTESSSQIIVYIDTLLVRGVGKLIDNNGDGVYDAFYSDETKQTVSIQKKGDSYLIDKNGDGNWEYQYNATMGLTSYQEPPTTPGFELVFVLSAMVVAIFLWKKKRIV
jgi:peptide/nickel transport system substrate-binding protein